MTTLERLNRQSDAIRHLRDLIGEVRAISREWHEADFEISTRAEIAYCLRHAEALMEYAETHAVALNLWEPKSQDIRKQGVEPFGPSCPVCCAQVFCQCNTTEAA
jgi:hypothetical protein